MFYILFEIAYIGISFFQTKKFADVIIPRGADNIGIILHTIAVYSASLMVA